MNKFWLRLLSSVACLLILSAVLVLMASLMYSVSSGMSHLWKLLFAVPMFAAGRWLLRRTDREVEK